MPLTVLWGQKKKSGFSERWLSLQQGWATPLEGQAGSMSVSRSRDSLLSYWHINVLPPSLKTTSWPAQAPRLPSNPVRSASCLHERQGEKPRTSDDSFRHHLRPYKGTPLQNLGLRTWKVTNWGITRLHPELLAPPEMSWRTGLARSEGGWILCYLAFTLERVSLPLPP